MHNRLIAIIKQENEELINNIAWLNDKVTHENNERLKLDIVNIMDQFMQQVNERLIEQDKTVQQVNERLIEHDFWNIYNLSNSHIEKKIFLLGTPNHKNIGDASIAIGEYEFIKKYFKEYKLVEITGYHMKKYYSIMQTIISDGDMIFMHGGGNLGDMYISEENIRRRVITDFPNKKIVIFPETIYFEDTIEGTNELKISADIYNRHTNLILFTRGKESLSFAQQHFPKVKCIEAVDMALMLDQYFGYERDGALLCIRDDVESILIPDEYDLVHDIVKRFCKSYDISNNMAPSDWISEASRGKIVLEELQKFARHKIVVTDRLHGMLFAVITHTPCVVMSAYTQKIREFVRYFNDSNAVIFIDKDISKLEEAMTKAINVEEPIYPILETKPFNDMYKAIIDN
jgi:pyruvyl transferase EpsI